MKVVSHFMARDGRLFDEEERCREHEEVLDAVDEATRLILPEKLDTVDFSNGHGYIQLTETTRVRFLGAYLELIGRVHPNLQEMAAKNPAGIVGRYLGDSGSLLYKLWGLLNQIDPQNRLWGQPFYAKNPGEGEPTLLEEL